MRHGRHDLRRQNRADSISWMGAVFEPQAKSSVFMSVGIIAMLVTTKSVPTYNAGQSPWRICANTFRNQNPYLSLTYDWSFLVA